MKNNFLKVGLVTGLVSAIIAGSAGSAFAKNSIDGRNYDRKGMEVSPFAGIRFNWDFKNKINFELGIGVNGQDDRGPENTGIGFNTTVYLNMFGLGKDNSNKSFNQNLLEYINSVEGNITLGEDGEKLHLGLGYNFKNQGFYDITGLQISGFTTGVNGLFLNYGDSRSLFFQWGSDDASHNYHHDK